jgi:hypothetical protein
MNRVIPDWKILNDLKQPLTNGERFLIEFLDKNLQQDRGFIYDHNKSRNENLSNYKGWLIFVQPFLNGSRPDIILLHPFVGCQIIEVKDWDLLHYSFEKDDFGKYEFCVSDRNGTYAIK